MRHHHEPMPERFNELAAYNTRVSQGIVHTVEYVERMAVLQAAFNEWNRRQVCRQSRLAVTGNQPYKGR